MDEAGGIDDDVEPAALLRQLRYPLGGRSFVEEINDKGFGPAARRPNFTRHPIQLLPITRAEVDSRPLARHSMRHGGAYRTAAAEDGGNFIFY